MACKGERESRADDNKMLAQVNSPNPVNQINSHDGEDTKLAIDSSVKATQAEAGIVDTSFFALEKPLDNIVPEGSTTVQDLETNLDEIEYIRDINMVALENWRYQRLRYGHIKPKEDALWWYDNQAIHEFEIAFSSACVSKVLGGVPSTTREASGICWREADEVVPWLLRM